MKLLIMQSSALQCCLIPLRPIYPPKHPILKHPQPTFLPHVTDQVSHPYKTTENYSSVYSKLNPHDTLIHIKEF